MTVALACLFLGLLAVAAWGDVRTRIIPNRLNLAIAAAAPLFWWATGVAPWPDAAWHVAAASLVFVLFAGMFYAGMMGGGDVKLMGAVALWLPPAAVLDAVLLTTVLGGGVTLLTIVAHRLRRAEGPIEVPYGVAIACAAGAILGQRYLYPFP